MSNDSSKSEKPKGFDISKLELEMSDEKRAAAEKQLKAKIRETAEGNAVKASALRSIGGVGAIDGVKRNAKRIQDAIGAIGLGKSQELLDAISGRGAVAEVKAAQERMLDLLPDINFLKGAPTLSINWRDIYGISAASRLAEVMRENHALYLNPASAFADVQRGAIADIYRSIRAIELPRLDILESSGIARMAGVFSAANVFQSIGLGRDYDVHMRAITSSLGGHMQAMTAAQSMRDAMLPLGLTDAIEGLLARSLAAQEALLTEYRNSAADAHIGARFDRRMAVLAMIINVLMFFMTVALSIEDRLKDNDAAVRENTEAVRQMQRSFEEMASQVQRMNEAEEAASEQDKAADAAVVGLLRGIADSLAEQANTGEDNDSEPPVSD